jgi:hypothetical protein
MLAHRGEESLLDAVRSRVSQFVHELTEHSFGDALDHMLDLVMREPGEGHPISHA